MVDSPAGLSRNRPEQQRAVQRVEDVLDAARELIGEGGIEPATITAIAERAGVALTALYRYFPNKQAIVRELAIRTFARDEETLVAPLLVEVATAEDLIRQGVTAYWDRNRQEPFRRNLRVAVQSDAELTALDVADNERVATVLGERLAELTGRTDLEQVRETTLLTLSLLDGLIQATAHVSDAEAHQLIDTFVRMVATEVSTRPSTGADE